MWCVPHPSKESHTLVLLDTEGLGDVEKVRRGILYALFFFFFKEFHLFIYGCVGSSFLCEGFLQLRQAGATLHRGARASHCRGLSCCGAQTPDAQAQ